jgi:hypothetical protein
MDYNITKAYNPSMEDYMDKSKRYHEPRLLKDYMQPQKYMIDLEKISGEFIN